MPEQEKEWEILRALAERLPEKVLQELLPGIEPESVRLLLFRLAGERVATAQSLQKNVQPQTPLPFSEAGTACTLYTDGASRGNPGEAGAGAVLVGPDNTERASRSLYLGQCTNNVAEYRALIAGLELATQYGCRELHIRMDSELIVRQIQGVYKVRNEQLKPFFARVGILLQQYEKWDIRHIPREENARADQLANRGIDSREEEIRADA